MKKILFLLLLTVSSYGQTLQNPTYGNTTTNTLKIKTPATVTSVNFIPAFGSDGSTISKIAPVNLPFLPKNYVSNYDVADSNTTISGTTFDAFGILTQSLTNKIFMFYREGAGHVSPDGKIAMRTSTDGGKTFSSRSIVYSDVAGVDCRNIAGGVTPSGRIVLFFLKYNYVVPTFYSFGTIYSDDDGLTWSAYSAQTVPSGASGYSPYGNMIAIADGKLALPYYIEKSDGTESTYLKFSSDNGATWGNDVLVGTDLTNGYNEASYAYLDGGVILCVSRRKDTLLLNQLLSIDNGQTWTNQGLIPSAYGSNVAPWLNSYIESNGEKYVALFSSLRGVTPGVNGVVGKKSDIISSGVSAWLAETRTVLATSPNSDSGYPSVINPRGGKKMLGMSYSSTSTANPLLATANYTFWNYTPSAVVPAMNATTNHLVKKTGDASLGNSRVIDDGTTLVVGSKVNASGVAYRAHYPGYSNIFQFKNLNLQELSTSGSEESTLQYNTLYDNTGSNKYMFNGGASWLYFGRTFFQLIKASSGTAGSNLTGLTAPIKVMYNTGNVLINGATDNSIDALQINGTASGSPATLSTQFATYGQVLSSARPYKVIVGRTSQTGTSAPTITILENNTGLTLTPSRSSAGIYAYVYSATQDATKIVGFLTDGAAYNTSPATFAQSLNTASNSQFSIHQVASGMADGLVNCSFEIRIYP